MNNKAKVNLRAVAAHLGKVLKGLDLDKQIYKEITDIGKQVAESSGCLEATDLAQIRALAEITQRIHDCNQLAKGAMHSDPDLYLKLLPKIQSDGALHRGLLRDLKATKTSRTSGGGNTAKKKTGDTSEWDGVL